MKLTDSDIKNINQLFEDPPNAGYVLDFTNKSMRDFFESEFSIDIDNDIYRTDGNSKMKRLRSLLKQGQRDEHRQMIETNLLGAMTVTEVFLPQLSRNKGDLVNISSVAGRVAPSGFAAYAATKWGINGWSEALRVELQPDIRVMVIEPGAIATELADHITHEESQSVAKSALDWAIPPSDIAEVIAFAVNLPKRTSINEILIRPTVQMM